jgi:plastocyanin
MAFSPHTFRASVGETVVWVNRDTTSHTVTSNGTGPLNSPLLTTGETYRFTFTQAGTYAYHCTPHAQTMWAWWSSARFEAGDTEGEGATAASR